MKRYLALDTSTEACSVALWEGGRVLGRREVVGREHTARLLPMLHGVLADAGTGLQGLDALVCCVGPGSFAGVRIGVGLVKGLALGLDIPVVPVSSLALIATGAMRRAGASQAVAAIDARMSEIYLGVYAGLSGGGARALQPDAVCIPATAHIALDGPWVAAGTGWGTYRDVLLNAAAGAPGSVDAGALPDAAHAFDLALADLEGGRAIGADDLAPAYLRDRVALTLAEQAQLRERR